MVNKRQRGKFSAEYKAEVVNLHRTTDKSITRIRTEHDLTDSAVRRWIAHAEVDDGQREGLTTDEWVGHWGCLPRKGSRCAGARGLCPGGIGVA